MANNSNRTSLTANVAVGLSNMMQTNVFMITMTVSSMQFALVLKPAKTYVTSGNTSNVCQTDLFPFTRNANTVSHAMNAWNKERAATGGPNVFYISCSGSYQKSLFLPKPANSLSKAYLSNAAIPNITTSM